MKQELFHNVERYIEERRRRKRWHGVLGILACVTVVFTAYMLLQSGRAMEPEHVHSQDCYTQVISVPRLKLVCSAETLELHKHISPCYDGEGDLVCNFADFVVHKHDPSCYDADGELFCTLPEIEPHAHTAECYAQTSQEELDQAEEVNAVPELICGKEEVVLHEHTDECYDEEYGLICGETQVLEHQHEDGCFEMEDVPVDTESLTCALPEDGDHTHGPLCYGVWELTCGMKEHRAEDKNQDEPDSAESDLPSSEANTIYTSDDIYDDIYEDTSSGTSGEAPGDTAEDAASDPSTDETAKPQDGGIHATPQPEAQTDMDGTLKVSLSYGDNKEYPDGYSSFTHSTMSGFIMLEPSGLTEDLENAIVTLRIPKQYVEKDSISIPRFTTSSSVTEYKINEVTEDDDNYCISITFIKYDKTQTLNLPFALSFKDDVVPDNYELPVTAGVYKDGSALSSSNEIIYKPKYKDWGIDKFVNSNKNTIYKEDGAEAVVTTKDENGNPYLDDRTYVHFSFIVNNVINTGSNLADFRDACQVTLTDTLPTYKKADGSYGTAVFDPEVNPEWTLNENRTAVSKTYTGANSNEVLNQIYNDELLLKFPDLKLEKDENDINDLNRVIASLNNHVSLQAVPSNAAEGETHPTAQDSLKFCITDKLGSTGKFTKTADKGNIYDAMMYKTNPYPWKIRLENNHIEPLEHIKIEDREIIGEDGTVAVEGLDKALKFVSIDSDYRYSTLPSGKTYADVIEKVVAYYEDQSQQEYYISPEDLDGSKNFTIEFDKGKVCEGYEIIFKDDYRMEMNEKVTFRAYTVYRDPEHTCIPAGTDKITYNNQARAVSNCMGVTHFLWGKYGYDMLPVSEHLEIGKATYFNDGNKNNMVGDIFAYYIYLKKGPLATPDQKEYKDIRVVDLLPDGVEFYKEKETDRDLTNGYDQYTDKYGNYGRVDIEENYHNSGRTAVIAHIKYEDLIKYWDQHTTLGTLSFKVRIREDAHSGTVTNYAYVVSEDLNEYTGKTGGTEDIYDLNNNGLTDDKIAYAKSDAVILAAQSIYAEKFIAPAESDAWNKQGLSLKAGSKFDYLLKVTNETPDKKTGLVVYDALPQIGDKNIFGKSDRGSEFPVRLREAITPPEEYTVYYTTSPDVYSCTMSEMVAKEDIWSTDVEDWSDVTAFKLVANDGISLTKDEAFQVRVPVCVPSEFEQPSMELLDAKTYQDQSSGTTAYLQSKNSFGFYTNEATEPKESNTVWVRVPFAGFAIGKVDSASKLPIRGATFTLKKDDDSTFIEEATSNEEGLLEFRNLTEGTYTLTETEFPAGYTDQRISVKVTITQNPTTMEYTVTFDDSFTGVGSNSDPLLIENELSTYELPATGGGSTALYVGAGSLAAAALSLMLCVRKKRERE